jgi:hypothetical protein
MYVNNYATCKYNIFEVSIPWKKESFQNLKQKNFYVIMKESMSIPLSRVNLCHISQ